ncbi:heavy metal transporter [Clostridium boliviensis]|uniref:Heavy metal transporter n=1 Tax=Clostridium boliviensis TaxID=318465 RepID=A0ABU4GMV9_9CLOT|nr:heavy metal transporter [Clostridium boliviensis]MDW2798956.1 heavy metal transporter [Clostridium boliviensis]
MKRIHYEISGIQNKDVKTQLKNALDKIDGISMINIDAGRGSIEVGYNQSTDENSIKSCIETVGCEITGRSCEDSH